jgi:hypothetical protein
MKRRKELTLGGVCAWHFALVHKLKGLGPQRCRNAGVHVAVAVAVAGAKPRVQRRVPASKATATVT